MVQKYFLLKFYSTLVIPSTQNRYEKNLVLIDAFDDVEFDSVAKKCKENSKGKNNFIS